MHRIGYLSGGSPSSARTSEVVEAFRDGLRELGYVEGRNITMEWRFSQGRGDQLPTLATELSQMKLEAIVTTGGPATRAAKQATSTIPIVMAFSGDPVGTGLKGRQTGRSACRATNEVRAANQSQDGEGAWAHHSAGAAPAGGSRHRMTNPEPAIVEYMRSAYCWYFTSQRYVL